MDVVEFLRGYHEAMNEDYEYRGFGEIKYEDLSRNVIPADYDNVWGDNDYPEDWF